MNIITLYEHSFATNLLPGNAKILDLGCRGFQFANAMRACGYEVMCFDIDELEGTYNRCAITNYNGFCGVEKSNDPQATKIKPGDEIPCCTIDFILEQSEFEMFDLIKMDIEGAEYEVIMSLTKPPAKQLSIEFHLHAGIYGYAEMSQMERKLAELGYARVQHDLTEAHGAGLNYWDSLFILR